MSSIKIEKFAINLYHSRMNYRSIFNYGTHCRMQELLIINFWYSDERRCVCSKVSAAREPALEICVFSPSN